MKPACRQVTVTLTPNAGDPGVPVSLSGNLMLALNEVLAAHGAAVRWEAALSVDPETRALTITLTPWLEPV